MNFAAAISAYQTLCSSNGKVPVHIDQNTSTDATSRAGGGVDPGGIPAQTDENPSFGWILMPVSSAGVDKPNPVGRPYCAAAIILDPASNLTGSSILNLNTHEDV